MKNTPGYDEKIAKATFSKLKALGIGVPLSGYTFPSPPILPKEEQDNIRKLQKEHRAYLSQDPKHDSRKRVSNAQKLAVVDRVRSKGEGLNQKQSAFLRALSSRGFDTTDTYKIFMNDFIVSFRETEWILLDGDTQLHKQQYGKGSIQIVDKILSKLR